MTVSWLAKKASQMFRIAMQCTGYAMVFLAFATAAKADVPVPTPEIDPGSAAGALTFLVGSLFLVTDKVRRK